MDFVIPAIDLIGGKAVRLTQGDFTQQKVYNTDPAEVARMFEGAGFNRLHLVDLDGARTGALKNLSVLDRIASATNLRIDFGGGVKTAEDVSDVLNAGATMVTIGSLAVKQPLTLKEWISRWGADKFFIGADVHQEKIKIKGWQEDAGITISQFLHDMITLGAENFFCTDIEMDGALSGIAVNLYSKIISAFSGISLTASGGVACMRDISNARYAGCEGIIVGKAIYEERISLKEIVEFNEAVKKERHAV
ncbi:MAG: 1-(5-phosphoribosyl)-5-[(5-phosphoribosylamino)methylideneamino]imidazole-4-carboxamide isomerase [Chitinophagaceae bacterium]|nr:MAG: 1-(5-phosphoribosyl)-5-[(5-phosphoribosylamino)methylideneamino]imidazole-4-carboxamide isomerase [Chitinophagaceae bacterium]